MSGELHIRPLRLHALHTRMALSALVKRFPIQRDRLPVGLDLLFEALNRMAIDDVVAYSRSLTPQELDLLAGYYDRATHSRVLLAVALILGSSKDMRAQGAVRRWLHHLPPMPEVMYLRQVWHAGGFRELFAGEVAWLHDLMEPTASKPIDFLLDRIHAGSLTLNDLMLQMPDEITPLIQALEWQIFSKGGPGISQIPSHRAAALAAKFLSEGKDEAVRGYFLSSPESGWPLSLVKLIYSQKGPPNERKNAFYSGFPKGVIWSLRQQLFQSILAQGTLDQRRMVFWRRFLHHLQDAFWQGQTLVLVLKPLRIFETLGKTKVVIEGGNVSDLIYPLDAHWEREMTDLLNDFVSWGQAR